LRRDEAGVNNVCQDGGCGEKVALGNYSHCFATFSRCLRIGDCILNVMVARSIRICTLK